MDQHHAAMAGPASSGNVSGHYAGRLSSTQRTGLRFTGSGSEYFRIWIVNLLLMLVTLGIYYPYAKVRRLRYFHANTLAGNHAFGFHASPSAMLRGYLLVSMMFVIYGVARTVAAIWPALLRSSLKFRLANTSWRGLRFRFTGSTGEVYRVLLPLFVPALLLVAPLVLVPDGEPMPPWYAFFSGLVTLATLLALPWLWWKLKKYQHDHYAFGPLHTTLQAGLGTFYAVFLKIGGVMLLGVLALGAVVGLAMTGAGRGAVNMSNPGSMGFALLAISLVFLAILLAQQVMLGAYLTSRAQNLLWSRTGGVGLQFDSALRLRPLFALTLKNWVLLLLTLALYWPFAAVAMARMRLEAVSLRLDADPQALTDAVTPSQGEAAGDAAGDLFGIDIGL